MQSLWRAARDLFGAGRLHARRCRIAIKGDSRLSQVVFRYATCSWWASIPRSEHLLMVVLFCDADDVMVTWPNINRTDGWQKTQDCERIQVEPFRAPCVFYDMPCA